MVESLVFWNKDTSSVVWPLESLLTNQCTDLITTK